MTPRESVRDQVLDTGLAMASEDGLTGLTIGRLAKAVDISKAGVYAHFDSKEDLLLGMLRRAVGRFITDGIRPALRTPEGEGRVRALFEAWLEWTQAQPFPGGCVFISSAVELDDRPGPLRDYLVSHQHRWTKLLVEAVEGARREGEFREDLDAADFVFELYSLILAFHYYHRLFRDADSEKRTVRAFEALLDRSRAPAEASS